MLGLIEHLGVRVAWTGDNEVTLCAAGLTPDSVEVDRAALRAHPRLVPARRAAARPLRPRRHAAARRRRHRPPPARSAPRRVPRARRRLPLQPRHRPARAPRAARERRLHGRAVGHGHRERAARRRATPGTTVIGNAACEPHVQDLARMLVKMGADIQGIGSNVLTVSGRADLHGCVHEISPDHIEIGSFMALAGVTGGELRIKDVNVDDLRMIRLVFDRLGLRSRRSTTTTSSCPAGRTHRRARRRRAQDQDPGRPVAGVPGRPHVDRGRARDPVRRLRARPRVDVREPPDLHRQARAHGRRHHAVRPAPGDHQRPEPAARRARRVARTSAPAWRCSSRRCAPTAARRSATSARSTAATSASTSACASWARASSASRPNPSPA